MKSPKLLFFVILSTITFGLHAQFQNEYAFQTPNTFLNFNKSLLSEPSFDNENLQENVTTEPSKNEKTKFIY